jgi:tetratricopeptide (TPR) repeat protein
MIDEGHLQWQQGDPQGADAIYSSAASISKEIGDDTNLGRSLIALAQIRMFYVGLDEGNRLCDQALKIFRTIGNKKEEAYALSIVGDIASPSNHQRAIELYQQSLALSREVNDRSLTAGRLMDLGIQERVRGNLAAADKYTQESLAIYHDIGERNREALLLNLLSVIRTAQGKLEEADRLSGQAIEILSAIQETLPLAQSRQNLATVKMQEGKLTEAESILNVAITEHQRAGNPGGVALASVQLAEVLVLERKLPESKAALQQFEDALRKNQNWRGEHITQSLIVRAKIDAAEGRTKRAQNEAFQAVQQALNSDQGCMLMEARLALGQIELQAGEVALGNRHLEMLVGEADSKGFGLISGEAQRTLASQRVVPSSSSAKSVARNGKS